MSKAFRPLPTFFRFGRVRTAPTPALSDVSLEVERGKVLALFGPNGSGKTTLLKLMATMLVPDSGRVRIEGHDVVTDANGVRLHVALALTTERSFYPRLTAFENLEFFACLEDVPRQVRRERVAEVLAAVAMQDSADVTISGFSSGLLQRLGIARALLKRPSVLLLDEPTRSLDPGSAEMLRELVRKLARGNTTLVLATHNTADAASAADSVVMLQAGRAVASRAITPSTTADELLAFYFQESPEARRQMAGVSA